MGILDKLLGGVVLPPTTRTTTRTSTGTVTHRTATPGTKGTHPADRPVNPMRQAPVRPKPEETPTETVAKPHVTAAEPAEPALPETPAVAIPEPPVAARPETHSAMTAEDILAELFAETEKAPAKAEPVEPAEPAEESGGSLLESKGSMGLFVAEPVEEPVPVASVTEPAIPEPVAAPVEAVVTAPEVVPAPAEEVDAAPWSDVTQRKLDRYFARMRQVYPDGVIVRLNTGQKKLAERGAQLRREIGMEGRLDEFFALGEFTYRRSEGGRPSVVKTDRQQAGLLRDLQAAFPEGVPSVAAVQQSDHRLYLNLRAAARRDRCTMTDFLKQHELLKKKECVS